MAREIAEGIVRRADVEPEGTVAEAIAFHGGLDVSACEAAGLAHDLGHPPFGHSGEVSLNRLLRARGVPDGFEGNAQTFRIVSRLDRRKTESGQAGLGMNLTRVSLAAVLKYPRLCPDELLVGAIDADKAATVPPKFGSYIDDRGAFEFASSVIPMTNEGDRRQSLEASVMDLADDISYSTHDFEDFYRDKRIDIPRVVRDLDDAAVWLEHNTLVSDVGADAPVGDNAFVLFAHKLHKSYPQIFEQETYVNSLRGIRGRIRSLEPFDENPLHGANVTMLLSTYLERMFASVKVTTGPLWRGGPSVYLDGAAWHEMQCLKTITKRYVVGSARMGLIERAQSSIISRLFEGLCAWTDEARTESLPQPLQSYLLEAESQVSTVSPEVARFRAISDYICSLSDAECFAMSSWLDGKEMPRFR